MSKILKAAIITVGSSFLFCASAQAQDYTLNLSWDSQQSAEENHKNVKKKIERYCKIQIRREAGLNIKDRSLAKSNCQTQLIQSYVKLTNK